MKKQLTFFLLLLGIGFSAQAQRSLYSFNYVVTVPTGNTADFIDVTSGRGFVFEYQKFIKDHLAVGGEVGHSTIFKRTENEVYTRETASLSGIQYRYQYAYPIMATAAYYHSFTDLFRPYFTLGIGTVANKRTIEMGMYQSEDTHWQFGFRPELGTLIQPSDNVAFRVGAKYYGTVEGGGLEGQSNLSFNVGLVIMNN
ncbi:outer membrane beta-barrel protein [Algoriphagus sp. H41]|uniref:Outer membrane beta-barrel protein n=1 Tax=Algoriphagus oliviformis TaxID=2811231 RepID=A0ABS3C9J5_9BACT|nr:outer membrane beta-barrel protein [Algoriphagus oliviformis]MBN7812836.1 outer membrane beta-barrel protein [Algoriphagus oliviformis]